ncbi:MAG: sulfurtransferase-like selenium metabolism protein YedF [Deltaproteobacteria bacterium]|nr:sulfurtransferase-like selenium metabolism protein YedF [Deltaproteobacteria bacterium]
MKTVDMLGQPCPIPVINAKKALREAKVGDVVAVLVDNDIARQNLEKMAAGLGHQAASTKTDKGHFQVTITLGEGKPRTAEAPGGLVVAVGSEKMGRGRDDSLALTLMKAFVHSLTELDTPPEYLLFYNGGAFLTTEGSACLPDLEAVSARGTVISTCGACLDFYGLTEKLKVGAVTNMYAIASTMAQAARLINV